MGDYGNHTGGFQSNRRGGYTGGYHKRKRESEPVDTLKQLLQTLVYLGDDALPGLTLEEEVVLGVVKQMKREARVNAAAVGALLIDCAVELPTKVPLYALLTGLLNADDPETVKTVLTLICAQLAESLVPNGNKSRARLLLRFLAALVVPNVLHASALADGLREVVNTCLEVAQASPEGDDGRAWQPYTDYVVRSVLLALPFGGGELSEAAPQQLQALMDCLDQYMAKRPRSLQLSLRPFYAAIKEDDLLAESDGGGASFLAEVYAAVKEMVDSGRWQLEAIPRVHVEFEVQLAASNPHTLPQQLVVPTATPVAIPEGASNALVGALVLESFPARGIIHFLDPQHTEGERPRIERLVAEEYMLDMVAAFESDRVECAQRLAKALPLPFPYEPLLCEVLFGQLLRIPRPRFKPVFYSALMVDLCKLLKLFPRAMSACVRESFARMNVLDVTLRGRLAEWLAYHLSNFEYMWPWAKWAHVLEAPAYDGQRRFCVAVMNRLVRLSYWDRVFSVLPEGFRELLPPKPEVGALPSAGDDNSDDAQGVWAAKMLQMVRSKASPQDIDSWIATNDLPAVLGGSLGVLRMMGRCLLVAGAKSYTHMVIALERYYGPLAARVEELGQEGEAALVDVACSVWRRSPQRAAMAVDRLMTLRLASAEAIVSWVFSSEGVVSLEDESLSTFSWEVLYNAINKTIAREQDAQEDVRAARVQVGSAEGEEAAAAQAQEALHKAQDYLQEATSQQQAAFLHVLRGFVELLDQGPAEGQEDKTGGGGSAERAMETEERSAWRDFILACLKSFVRQYNVQVACIANSVEEQIIGQPGLSNVVKEAILSQLFL